MILRNVGLQVLLYTIAMSSDAMDVIQVSEKSDSARARRFRSSPSAPPNLRCCMRKERGEAVPISSVFLEPITPH